MRRTIIIRSSASINPGEQEEEYPISPIRLGVRKEVFWLACGVLCLAGVVVGATFNRNKAGPTKQAVVPPAPKQEVSISEGEGDVPGITFRSNGRYRIYYWKESVVPESNKAEEEFAYPPNDLNSNKDCYYEEYPHDDRLLLAPEVR